ncbi:MAG: molybdopterin-binding protein [Gammaproteobacteria bacterium]|nr:molybdopterin-binding protein [Gammaproteobacteria bacterium]
MTDESNQDAITAALVLIGNELLSGRTRDANMHYLAARLTEIGIRLVEARVVRDVQEDIIAAVNTLRNRVTYVFTTGGIGPTHDDITAAAVASAFDVPLAPHPEAVRRLTEYFSARGVDANAARMRMANTAAGAELIDNPVSVAPGFRIGNVFVLAGVPNIMQAMLEEVIPTLEHGEPVLSATVICNLPEGQVAAGLEEIQARYQDLDIGSYPGKDANGFRVSLVVRGTDPRRVAMAARNIEYLVTDLNGSVLDDG